MSKLKEEKLLELLGIAVQNAIEYFVIENSEFKERIPQLQKAHKQIREIIVQHSDKDTLPKKLKSFMAEKGLTIKDVSDITEKDPKTIWQFLHQKVKANGRTTYSIRKLLLVGEDVKK